MSKRILIIDDDADDIEFFIEAVHGIDASIECSQATNGEEGLSRLRRGEVNPEYIFLDLNMPRLNGKEFLAEIKKDGKLSSIPVIMYSTSGIESDIKESMRLGAQDFIVKPTRLSELTERIESVMNTGV